MAVSKKKLWSRVFFLGVTATALVTECWFAWDGDPETDPWTDLIGDYVPWQAALAVFGALLLWVPAHFIVRYRKEIAEQKARVERRDATIDHLRTVVGEYKEAVEPWGITVPSEEANQKHDPGQSTLF